jgi:hypothetical protein
MEPSDWLWLHLNGLIIYLYGYAIGRISQWQRSAGGQP